MSKINYLIIGAIFIISSCTNEIVTKGADPHIYPKYDAPQRVKKIVGDNEMWGKYTYYINYDESSSLLANCYRVDENQDTLGRIGFSAQSDVVTDYSVIDYVVTIHQDSIDYINDSLRVEHGEGNYNLKDTIYKYHLGAQTRLTVRTAVYEDMRPYWARFTYYEPVVPESDSKEDFTTDVTNTMISIENYEYALDGRIVNNRRFDEHINDPEDTDDNEKFAYKEEVTYDANGKIQYLTLNNLTAGENFTPYETFTYTYSGENLASIKSDAGFNRTFTYSGSTVTMNDNGEVYKYTLNGNGLVTRIEYPNGDYMELEYEDGVGTIDWFIPQLQKFLKTPYAR